MQGGSKGEFSKLGFENLYKFADNKLGGACRQDGIVTRMHRELEGNSGKIEVAGSRHDKAKVTMAATATSRGDGMHISVKFLGEEF